ncbi:transcriptional regulator with XRE-family HTH domain [Salirhabdus euzebyi]|uniref:Transcriptional regulator with XRE-family HTH domain n=1 Tax=Salirhabdus euzebyi TaxID=394506 RepID=A0A841Q898_9BACI|nr:helix-turn-helix transcriptional regulator [Salirhabdus euzebyi]MBB6454628.1 transcriptional regulator with XRE-family HTH domain [Salirhabdus euzebyi]
MQEKQLSKIIGERIRMMRKAKRLSQEELAHKAGLHPTYIGQLERGEKNATIESVSKVANGLQVNLEEIVRFAQPNDYTTQNETIVQLVHQLYKVSEQDQQTILNLIKILLDWKERTPS